MGKCANVQMRIWKCGSVKMWKRNFQFAHFHISTFAHFQILISTFAHLHIAKEKGFAESETFFFGAIFPTPANPICRAGGCRRTQIFGFRH